MALTVYLGESLLSTFLSYHWGLGWFGQVNGPERMLIVPVIYSTLVLFANLWLRAFPMGLMEWLWRVGTYGRLRPLCAASPP